MHRPGGAGSQSLRILTCVALAALVFAGAAPAAWAAARPIHPIFVANPDLSGGEEAERLFRDAAARRRLPAVEVVVAPADPSPRARELIAAGQTALRAGRFAEAERALRDAAREVDASGAAGLDTSSLAELFVSLGAALQKADWKEAPAPIKEIAPPEAKQAYLRAAVLDRRLALSPDRHPPLAVQSFALAVAEVERRPRGSLLVRAPSSARISIDAGPTRAGISPSGELVFGDHWIRVEDPGRTPWSAVVPLAEQAMEVDVPPMPARSLADGEPAARARRQRATFALVAELVPGRPRRLELRLVRAETGERADATSVDFPGDPAALDAAINRLEQRVRSSSLEGGTTTRLHPPGMRSIAVAPVMEAPDRGPDLSDDPAAWARRRWPLLTAIGVAVGTTLVLGVVAASSDGR